MPPFEFEKAQLAYDNISAQGWYVAFWNNIYEMQNLCLILLIIDGYQF
jgi:hypothetical protein